MSRLHRLRGPLALAAGAGLFLAGCTSGGSGSGSGGSSVYTTISGTQEITAGAPMNPFNASGNFFLGMDTMQLGFDKQSPTNPNDFLPGLAASWTATSTGLTVTLQPGAKWSDGTPVTVDDVKDSMAIALTQGNATVGAGFLTQGLDVGSVTAVGSSTIQINQAPGGTNQYFTREVLNQPIVPAEVYGTPSLLPADIWGTIGQVSSSNTATATAAVNSLTTIGKAISAYAPAKDISAGPYVISRINSGEALLTKNPDFFAASKIGPSQVIERHYSGNTDIIDYMKDGELDSVPYIAISTAQQSAVEAAGYQAVTTPSFVQAGIAFNESDAPYNITAARQALAYVINRQAVTQVGEPVSGTASPDVDGMIASATQQWLTSAQTSQLNPYDTDTAKATSLLQSAGFKKNGSQWVEPNGKAWTITLQSVNGFSDWNSGATVVANELTAFGIPTQVQLTADFPTYKTEMAAGKYAVGFWLYALGPQASAAYDRLYGSDDGYTANANGTVGHADGGTNWQHTPTSYTVNGTTIDPGQLTAQLTTLPASQQAPIVAQLAVATNENVPYVPLWDYKNVQYTLGKRFTDQPADGDSDLAGLMYNSPGVWMMQGYVKAK